MSNPVSLKVAKGIADNIDLTDVIKNSPHANLYGSIPLSPDMFLIYSPLESGELTNSPLEDLLHIILSLDILSLIALLLILFICVNIKFKHNIISFLFKYFPNLKNHKFLSLTDESTNKFYYLLIIINLSTLFFIFFVKIYFQYTLTYQIHSFVEVYNYIHEK